MTKQVRKLVLINLPGFIIQFVAFPPWPDSRTLEHLPPFPHPSDVPAFLLPTVGSMLHTIFPGFDLADWLTPIDLARTKLARELQAGVNAIFQLLVSRNDTYRQDFNASWYAETFDRIASAGRKDLKGPLLVIQGPNDMYVPYNVTTKTVEDTWRLYPDRDLEYLVAHGTGHIPALDATRQIWLQWIEDRLVGKPVKTRGGVRTEVRSMLPDERYLHVGNSILAWAGLPQFEYQIVLGL